MGNGRDAAIVGDVDFLYANTILNALYGSSVVPTVVILLQMGERVYKRVYGTGPRLPEL